MTLDEIKAIQKKAEKKALLFFALYEILLIVICLSALCYTDFFDRKALRLLPFAFFLLGIFLSKILLFLTPKEFRGKIAHLNVSIEQKKKYLSGQAGLTYTATRHKVIDLVVENEKGKIRSFTLPYRKHYETLKANDEISVFRFVDEIYFEKSSY